MREAHFVVLVKMISLLELATLKNVVKDLVMYRSKLEARLLDTRRLNEDCVWGRECMEKGKKIEPSYTRFVYTAEEHKSTSLFSC